MNECKNHVPSYGVLRPLRRHTGYVRSAQGGDADGHFPAMLRLTHPSAARSGVAGFTHQDTVY